MAHKSHSGFKIRLIVWVTNVLFNLFLGLPILLYSYFQFNRLRKVHKLLIIQKRYPFIVQLECSICCFLLIIERNLIAFLNGDFVNEIHYLSQPLHDAMWRFERVIYPSLSIIVWCALWRCWHIYYDLQIAKILSESQWKRYLNSNLLITNWYLTNKAKYGSTKYTQRVMILGLVFITLIRIAVFQVYEFNGKSFRIERVIDAMLYVFPVSIIGILAFKAPSISDKFYIKQEMVYFTLTLYTSLLIYCVLIAIRHLNIIDHYWIALMYSYLGGWAGWSLCIIQTLWIKHKIHNDPAYDSATDSIQEVKDELLARSVHMKQYIAQQNGFERFVSHLQREFSLELILFFIEVFQLKMLMKAKGYNSCCRGNIRIEHLSLIRSNTETESKIEDPDMDGAIFLEFEVSDQWDDEGYNLDDYEAMFKRVIIPKSQIVYQLFEEDKPNLYRTESFIDMLKLLDGMPEQSITDDMKVKVVMSLLFIRYIKCGSELEINISASCRQALHGKLGDTKSLIEKPNINVSELYHVFDEALHEICTLLLYSFDRFKMEYQIK
eukprot:531563_1